MKISPTDLEEFRTMLCGRARVIKYHWEWPYQVEVEDVVSATIEKAWNQREQFRGDSRGMLANWLLSILHHEAIDTLRKETAEKRDGGRVISFGDFISESHLRLEQALGADISTPSAKAQKEEIIQAAYAAIELLPERQRQALLARFIGVWSISQIADQLQTTEKAVTGLIERALTKLRDLLAHLK